MGMETNEEAWVVGGPRDGQELEGSTVNRRREGGAFHKLFAEKVSQRRQATLRAEQRERLGKGDQHLLTRLRRQSPLE